MELKKRTLQGLRRVRDRERLSMNMLFTILGVLRAVHAPYIPETDMEAAAQWFLGLSETMQTQMIDDAMGVNN